jgi:hypothetical protein
MRRGMQRILFIDERWLRAAWKLGRVVRKVQMWRERERMLMRPDSDKHASNGLSAMWRDPPPRRQLSRCYYSRVWFGESTDRPVQRFRGWRKRVRNSEIGLLLARRSTRRSGRTVRDVWVYIAAGTAKSPKRKRQTEGSPQQTTVTGFRWSGTTASSAGRAEGDGGEETKREREW